MSNYPESADVFVDKTGNDYIASSDPNVAYDAIETTQGMVGALGKPQSWSTTLLVALSHYRRNMEVYIDSGALKVKPGEAMLIDTNGSKFNMRQNVSEVTLSDGNLDTGTLIATNYWVYLKAGAAATTAPCIYSTDSVAPSAIGTIPYTKIGWFYNGAAGSLAPSFAGNIKDGSCDVPNSASVSATGETALTTVSTSFVDMADMICYFGSNGRPIEVTFTASFGTVSNVGLTVEIDGTEYEIVRQRGIGGAGDTHCMSPVWTVEGIPAGAHTAKIKWFVSSGTAYQQNGDRFMSVKEL